MIFKAIKKKIQQTLKTRTEKKERQKYFFIPKKKNKSINI